MKKPHLSRTGSFSDVLYEGALQKKGKNFSRWHFRWFILLNSGAILCKSEGKKLKTRFIVTPSTSIRMLPSSGGSQPFVLEDIDGESLELRAPCAREADAWANAVKDGQNWMLMMNSSPRSVCFDPNGERPATQLHVRGPRPRVLTPLPGTVDGSNGWYKNGYRRAVLYHTYPGSTWEALEEHELVIERGVMLGCPGTVQGETGWYQDLHQRLHFYEVDYKGCWKEHDPSPVLKAVEGYTQGEDGVYREFNGTHVYCYKDLETGQWMRRQFDSDDAVLPGVERRDIVNPESCEGKHCVSNASRGNGFGMQESDKKKCFSINDLRAMVRSFGEGSGDKKLSSSFSARQCSVLMHLIGEETPLAVRTRAALQKNDIADMCVILQDAEAAGVGPVRLRQGRLQDTLRLPSPSLSTEAAEIEDYAREDGTPDIPRQYTDSQEVEHRRVEAGCEELVRSPGRNSSDTLGTGHPIEIASSDEIVRSLKPPKMSSLSLTEIGVDARVHGSFGGLLISPSHAAASAAKYRREAKCGTGQEKYGRGLLEELSEPSGTGHLSERKEVLQKECNDDAWKTDLVEVVKPVEFDEVSHPMCARSNDASEHLSTETASRDSEQFCVSSNADRVGKADLSLDMCGSSTRVEVGPSLSSVAIPNGSAMAGPPPRLFGAVSDSEDESDWLGSTQTSARTNSSTARSGEWCERVDNIGRHDRTGNEGGMDTIRTLGRGGPACSMKNSDDCRIGSQEEIEGHIESMQVNRDTISYRGKVHKSSRNVIEPRFQGADNHGDCVNQYIHRRCNYYNYKMDSSSVMRELMQDKDCDEVCSGISGYSQENGDGEEHVAGRRLRISKCKHKSAEGSVENNQFTDSELGMRNGDLHHSSRGNTLPDNSCPVGDGVGELKELGRDVRQGKGKMPERAKRGCGDRGKRRNTGKSRTSDFDPRSGVEEIRGALSLPDRQLLDALLGGDFVYSRRVRDLLAARDYDKLVRILRHARKRGTVTRIEQTGGGCLTLAVGEMASGVADGEQLVFQMVDIVAGRVSVGDAVNFVVGKGGRAGGVSRR